MPETLASLVERARRGETDAFEELVRRHLRAAHAVALAVLQTYSDAEDVVQEAFMTAIERLDDCRDPERFAGWLLQIVRNRARNARDHRKLREASPLDNGEEAPAELSPARQAEQAELRDRLLRALSALPEVQREVVLLHDIDGWQHREIAAALGCSEVMSRQHDRILEILERRRPEMDAIMAEVFPRMRAVATSVDAEVRGALTPEQREKLDQIRTQRIVLPAGL